jgi:hypothetical protein
MSSHLDWVEEVVASHNANKPFAPENGEPLKFSIGDEVIYTNAQGCKFKRKITGFYKPSHPCSRYATGGRYLLDWDCYWVPAKQADLSRV